MFYLFFICMSFTFLQGSQESSALPHSHERLFDTIKLLVGGNEMPHFLKDVTVMQDFFTAVKERRRLLDKRCNVYCNPSTHSIFIVAVDDEVNEILGVVPGKEIKDMYPWKVYEGMAFNALDGPVTAHLRIHTMHGDKRIDGGHTFFLFTQHE